MFNNTTEDSYSGNASLKLNSEGYNSELLQEVEYDPNTTYLVTLYAKMNPELYTTDGKEAWLSNAKVWLGAESALNANYSTKLRMQQFQPQLLRNSS